MRDVAKMFERADVPRTERSIINWCQPNRQGIARLDAFYDANERKYFITPESTTRAIQEEQAKQQSSGVAQPSSPKEIPNASEAARKEAAFQKDSEAPEEIGAMRAKMRDLEITNKVKDQFIGMLEKDRENYIRNLMNQSHRIGQLETQLLQLGAPIPEHVAGETFVESTPAIRPLDQRDASSSFSIKAS